MACCIEPRMSKPADLATVPALHAQRASHQPVALGRYREMALEGQDDDRRLVIDGARAGGRGGLAQSLGRTQAADAAEREQRGRRVVVEVEEVQLRPPWLRPGPLRRSRSSVIPDAIPRHATHAAERDATSRPRAGQRGSRHPLSPAQVRPSPASRAASSRDRFAPGCVHRGRSRCNTRRAERAYRATLSVPVSSPDFRGERLRLEADPTLSFGDIGGLESAKGRRRARSPAPVGVFLG